MAPKIAFGRRSECVPDGDAWVLLGRLPFVNLVVPYSLVTGLYGDADPLAAALLGTILVVSRITSRLEACVERFGMVEGELVATQTLVTAAASHRPE